jgi:hypothetical protein
MAPLIRRSKMIFSLNYMVCSFITTTPLSSVEILILLGIKKITAMELSTRNGVTKRETKHSILPCCCKPEEKENLDSFSR